MMALALMDIAQSRGFVLRSRVHLLAHGQRIEPFGEAKVGPLCERPQAGYDLQLAIAIAARRADLTSVGGAGDYRSTSGRAASMMPWAFNPSPICQPDSPRALTTSYGPSGVRRAKITPRLVAGEYRRGSYMPVWRTSFRQWCDHKPKTRRAVPPFGLAAGGSVVTTG
jgi:hypothetical protein